MRFVRSSSSAMLWRWRIADDEPTFDPAVLRELTRQLVDEWRAVGDISHRPKLALLARTLVGLTTMAHRKAEAVLLLADQGFRTEAAPLIRQIFECAIYASWLSQMGDRTASAYLADADRSTRLLYELGSKADVAMPEWARDEMERLRIANETERQSEIKIHKACNALQGGDQFYFLYRHLCGLSHAGWSAVSPHVDAHHDGRVAFRMEAHDAPGSLLDWVVAASLMWCARATDDFTVGKPRGKHLRQLADAHQIQRRLIKA
jgi:Family of unknown function (DUF5677)